MNKISYPKNLRGVRMLDSHYRVLMELWNYSDENGNRAFPGVARLALDCCMSTSTVKRALRELEAQGWVRQESRGRRGKDGVGWASEYTLTIPTGHQCTIEDGQQVNPVESTAHPVTVNSSLVVSQQLTSEPPSDPLPNPGSDPLSTDSEIDAKEENMSKLDDLTSQFLAAYPKRGNHNVVRSALIPVLNANGGAAHFPVLLAYVTAYADQVQKEGREDTMIKAPQNFLRDSWYRDNVVVPKTKEQRFQEAYDRAAVEDVRFICETYGGYPTSLPGNWESDDHDRWYRTRATEEARRQWIGAAAEFYRVAINSDSNRETPLWTSDTSESAVNLI